ncbi:MAG: hypothetical protein JRI25_00820 [Deltaproteobacteria bacterium]|nr:hypothetical protein [Deltaproteobacteria bacterium]MBW2253120.1 hypothetical protein [Deltaproteobacteria bacterium]
MLWLAAALLNPVAQAEDLTILVESGTSHIALNCGSDQYGQDAAEGMRQADGRVAHTFPIRPSRECQVTITREVGSLEQLGTWACTNSGCIEQGGGAAPVSVPVGTLRVLMAMGTSHNQLELVCVSGYRERVPLEDHVGTFTGVPSSEDCTLNFKGGPPMKYRPISWGAWECHLVSNTPVCKKQ